MDSRNKFAFTLVEVLIVLGIIGVIASLTIPGLVQDIQDAQFKVAWKKAYADIEQASRRIMIDNGGNFKGLCEDNDTNCLNEKYKLYLVYTKSCNAGQSFGNCWSSNSEWKNLNGNLVNGGNNTAIVLNNGNFVRFYWFSKTCTHSAGSMQECGFLNVDVNGFKGPNTTGKDIFYAGIYENSIKPYGVSGDGRENTCKKTSSGYSCSAEYLYK